MVEKAHLEQFTSFDDSNVISSAVQWNMPVFNGFIKEHAVVIIYVPSFYTIMA